jgi:hypothetical protein
MSYEKQTWLNRDLTKPLNDNRMNHIEDGIFQAAAVADAAQVAADLDGDTATLVGDGGTATGAAVSAAIVTEAAPVAATTIAGAASPRQSGTMVAIGSSLVGYLWDYDAPDTMGQNWVRILQSHAQGKLLITAQAGHSGQSVLDVESRFQVDVIDTGTAAVTGDFGAANSTTKGRAHFELAKTAYEGMVVAALEAGVEVYPWTIPPRNNTRTAGVYPTDGGTTPEFNVEVYHLTHEWNLFLRRIAVKYKLRVIDIYAAVSDPVTGNYQTDYTTDGVHFTASGNYKVAKTLWAAIQDRYPQAVALIEKDRYNPLNAAQDPLFFDTFVTGPPSVPQGFSMSGVTADLTVTNPAKDAPLESGEWTRCTKVSGAGGSSIYTTRSFATWTTKDGHAHVAGNLLGLGFRWRIVSRSGTTPYVSVTYDFRGVGGSADIKRSITPMSQWVPRVDGTHVTEGFCYIEAEIPADAVDFRFTVGFPAACNMVFDLGELSWYDLTATGLGSLASRND